MGMDGVRFYTEQKNVTATWFPEDMESCGTVDTWDGTISSMPVDTK
jgi:malonate-semialdehyde dehydrogenase (acetylating)/methylmalonate-semialdehyde dehydrogenase